MPEAVLTTPATDREVAPVGVTVYCHLDVIERRDDGALSFLAGWVVAEQGFEITAVGVRADAATVLRCNYPFHRGDTKETITLAGSAALTGFNLLCPDRLGFKPQTLDVVIWVAAADSAAVARQFRVPLAKGVTHRLDLTERSIVQPAPKLTDLPRDEVSTILENRLFDTFAARRQLTLRLDLINKCNLRCVMCHYSNEDFAKRPVQRIAPDQFFGFFDSIAPVTRDVVLSCGDEPLMSPHFETIVREIAARDPEVRMRFCTNGMLMSEKIAHAIIDANIYMVMFSFDGVASETLHRIRVGSDFKRILQNVVRLKRLRDARGGPRPRFVFNYVMLDSNIHEAPLFVEVARRLGADYIDFRHVVPFDFYDIEHEMLEHDKPKYNYYRTRIAEAARASGLEVYLPDEFETSGVHDPAGDPQASLAEFNSVLQGLGEPPTTNGETRGREHTAESDAIIPDAAHFFCERPFQEAMIYNQRDVFPCPWHREKMGTLDGKTTLQEIFFGENFRRVRRAMLDPQGAPGCSHCPIKAKYLPTQLR